MFRLSRVSCALVAVVMAVSSSAWGVDPLAVPVSPQDKAVHYVGRWDTREAAGPKADWSASEVGLHFQGAALNAKFKASANDAFQIIIDGKSGEVLQIANGQSLYRVAEGLANGEHTVQLVKRTEPNVSGGHAAQFLGFELSQDGKALPWTVKPAHRIEMIGDSITCGYGNEDTDKSHHFSPKTENAYMTWGPLTARNFAAECHIVAWSGRKMFPNNTIPEIYGQSLGGDRSSKWDFSQWTPEVVVINLATNDYGYDHKPTLPDAKGWIAAYEKFIKETVRKNYPKADVFICAGPMMWGAPLEDLRKNLQTIKTDLAADGESKVHILELAPQDAKDGYGADWHPNIATQKKMAAALSKAIEKELGWKMEKAE